MASAGRVRAGQAFVELILDTKDVQYGLKRLQSNFKSYQKIIEEYSVITISFAVGSLAPIRKAVSEFGEFDRKMKLLNAITNATQHELESMSKTVRHLGRTTLFSAQQVSDAMVILARAGFSSREAERSAKYFLNLSLSTATDLEKSIEIAAATMRGFSMPIENVSEVVDILSAAANASAQSLEELGHGFKFIVPIAKSAGMSLKETAQMSAYLANMGLKGSNAATNLRNILLRMPRMQERYRDLLGVEVLDDVGNLRSLIDVLRDVRETSEDLPSGKRLTIFNDLFGRYGVSGASAFVTGTDMSNVFEIIDESAGESVRVADRVSASISGAFAIMTGNVKDSFIELGDALQPVLFELSGEVSLMAMDFSSFIRENQSAINDFVRILAEMFREIARIVARIGKFGTNYPVLSKMVLLFATFAPQVYAVSKAFTVLKTAFTGVKALGKGLEKGVLEAYRGYYTRVKNYEKSIFEEQQPEYDKIKGERVDIQKDLLNFQDQVDQMEQDAKKAVKERNDAESLFTKATESAKEIETEAFEYDTALQNQADYLRETEKKLKEELSLRKRYLELQKNIANEELRKELPDIVARNEEELKALRPSVRGLEGIDDPLSYQEFKIKDIEIELDSLRNTIKYANEIINKDVGSIDVSKYTTTFERFNTSGLKQREAALKNEIQLRERWLAYTNEIAEKERISSEVAKEYKKSKAKSFKRDITTIKNLEGTDLGVDEQADFIEKRKKELTDVSQKIADIEKDTAVQFDSVYLEDYNKAVQEAADAFKELKIATDAYNESPKSEQKHYRDTVVLNEKVRAYETALKNLELLEQSFGKNLPINEQDYLEGVRLAKDEKKKLSQKHISVGTALKEKEKEYKSIQTQIENAVGGTSDVSTPELAAMSKDLNLLWTDYMAAASSVDSFKKSLKDLKKTGAEANVIEASERKLLDLESIAADHKTTYEHALKEFFIAKKKESEKTIEALEASLRQAEQKILDVRSGIGPTDARDALDAFMKEKKYKSFDDVKTKADNAKREFLGIERELLETSKKYSELFDFDGYLLEGKGKDRYNLIRRMGSLSKKRKVSFDKWRQLSLDQKEYSSLSYDFQEELGNKAEYNPTEVLEKMLGQYTKEDTKKAFEEGRKTAPKKWTYGRLWSEYERLLVAREGAEKRVKDKQEQLNTTYTKDQNGMRVETEGPAEARKRRSYQSQLDAALRHQEKINSEFEITAKRINEVTEIVNEEMPFDRANREFEELAKKLEQAKKEGSLIDIEKLEKSHDELVELRKEYSVIKEELSEASKAVVQAETEYQNIQNKAHLKRDKGDLARAQKDLEAAKSNYDNAVQRANDAETRLNDAKKNLNEAIGFRDKQEKVLDRQTNILDNDRGRKVSKFKQQLGGIYIAAYNALLGAAITTIGTIIVQTIHSIAISSQKATANADAKRAEAQRVASERELYQKKFEQLREYNSNRKKTTEDIANAESIVMTLNNRFGELNLTMDASTKQVKNMESSYLTFADVMRDLEIKALEASITAEKIAKARGQKLYEEQAYKLAKKAAGVSNWNPFASEASFLYDEVMEQYEILTKNVPDSVKGQNASLYMQTARQRVAEGYKGILLKTGGFDIEGMSEKDFNKIAEEQEKFTRMYSEMTERDRIIAEQRERLNALEKSKRKEESGKLLDYGILSQTAFEEWIKDYRSDHSLGELKGDYPGFEVSKMALAHSTALKYKYGDMEEGTKEGKAMSFLYDTLDFMQGAEFTSDLVEELDNSLEAILHRNVGVADWNQSAASAEYKSIREFFVLVEDMKALFKKDKELQDTLAKHELDSDKALYAFILEKISSIDSGDRTKLPEAEKEYTGSKIEILRQSIEDIKKEYEEQNKVLVKYLNSQARLQEKILLEKGLVETGVLTEEGKKPIPYIYRDEKTDQNMIAAINSIVEATQARQAERIGKINSAVEELNSLQKAQVSRLTSIGTFSGREARDLAYTESWERKQAENLDKLVAIATISKEDNRKGFGQVITALQSDNENI